MNTIPDNIDFQVWYDMMEPAVMIRPARDIVREAIALLQATPPTPVVMPWLKLRDLFSFRPCEVTVYAGQNGSGKSMITTMIALQLIAQKRNVLIASFEMKPTTTLQRMVRQFAGTQYPSVEDYQRFASWAGNYLWFYDRQGDVSPTQVIGVCNYAAKELKMQDVFIDSLMKCVKGEDDYNSQKDFVSDCTNLARDTNLHVHLVHHIRKGATDEAMPQKVDMKGSGSIADQVDNVFMVWRNKKKERLIEAGQLVEPDEPDAMLLCEKQRNGENEPRLRLWYDRKSQQFTEKSGANPYRFDSDF